MASTRHGWRVLTAILQIAALVLLALPVQAAGHRHAALHHHAAPAAHAPAMLPHDGVAASDTDETRNGLHAACWLGCCACHALLDTASAAPLRAGWVASRLPTPAPDAARPGAWPEALPEPPRTDA